MQIQILADKALKIAEDIATGRAVTTCGQEQYYTELASTTAGLTYRLCTVYRGRGRPRCSDYDSDGKLIRRAPSLPTIFNDDLSSAIICGQCGVRGHHSYECKRDDCQSAKTVRAMLSTASTTSEHYEQAELKAKHEAEVARG
jgi:hypothetical protein